MTGTRLLTFKRMDHQKSLSITPNLRAYSMCPECKEVHQGRHLVGIQQCMHQEGGQAQSCVYHKPRTV